MKIVGSTQPGTQGELMKMKVFAVMAVAVSAVMLTGAGGDQALASGGLARIHSRPASITERD